RLGADAAKAKPPLERGAADHARFVELPLLRALRTAQRPEPRAVPERVVERPLKISRQRIVGLPEAELSGAALGGRLLERPGAGAGVDGTDDRIALEPGPERAPGAGRKRRDAGEPRDHRDAAGAAVCDRAGLRRERRGRKVVFADERDPAARRPPGERLAGAL